MTRASVSCIIPVFNGAPWLADAIQSVLSQAYSPIEIIVVDDGSTDGTAAIARSFADRLVYLRQENAGPAAARNRGLATARGELIGFLDADDLWHESKVQRQVLLFNSRPEAGFTVAHVCNFKDGAPAGEPDGSHDDPRGGSIPGYVTGTLLARREVFDQVGPFAPDRKYSDAAEWFLRAEALGVKGVLLPEVLLFRRLHPESLSHTQAARSSGEFLHLIKTELDRRRGGMARGGRADAPD